MLRAFARRLLWSFFTIWAVVTLAFVINQKLPSDPARAIAGPQARPADVDRIRKQLGLDRPLATQYRIFMGRLVHLRGEGDHASCASLGPLHVDLGVSYQIRKPVVVVLGERLPRTFFLAIAAIFVQVVIGVGAGVAAAVRRNTLLDYGAVGLTLVGISAPTFLTGIFLQYVFAYQLGWLPLDGFGLSFGEHVVCIVLPALTLGIAGAAYYTRLVRDDMIDLLKQDFVRTARAKGVAPFGVVVKHALRNALMPIVTVIGLDFGTLVGGAIVTEKLFRWPGLGQLSVDAVFDRDAPIIMGTVIVSSTAIVLANLLVDLSYTLLDPRVRSR
ncbi:MAG TPA: ABC transporter permease [Polyangiaceae bacterium]|nr:ABC transporter permease [Polyangiaceae bacterium]